MQRRLHVGLAVTTMNKSILERIFPHSPSSTLPQYEYETPSDRSFAGSPSRISLRDRSNSPHTPPKPTRNHLQAAPLSASVIHHDDPFLPVERAAKALERTLQDLISAQSDALEATLPQDQPDDASSVGSPTPTPSLTSSPSHGRGPRTTPIRQPRQEKISLKAARRGLERTMTQFAALKAEELQVLKAESQKRDEAMQKTRTFEEKKLALQSDFDSAVSDDTKAGAAALRSEAAKIEQEIQELETRLFELRTRHHHLVTQAEQHDNTVDSKLSSYKHSLTTVERDVRDFLRRPPVPCSLSNYDESHSTRGGMYALNADRRTLDMAREQWSREQDLLGQRKANIEHEQQAFRSGAELWKGVVEKITNFEKHLRQLLHEPSPDADAGADTVQGLNELRRSLTTDYNTAEDHDWKLLMVAIGAELAALERARELLAGPEDPPPVQLPAETHDQTNPDDPPADLLNGDAVRPSSAGSNESLKATLAQFPSDSDKSHDVAKSRRMNGNDATSLVDTGDSEDDDPGPDFLVSHS